MLNGKLLEIIEYKKEFVANLPDLKQGRLRGRPLDAVKSLRNKPFICEVKKASPSLGEINISADPAETAKIYGESGAGAVSVLTDEKYFSGSYDDLASVTAEADIPVLCKDFFIDTRQIDYAYAYGADIILIMASTLEKVHLERMADYAYNLGLNILFEIHEEAELEKLVNTDVKLLGVNNRNLKTLQIDKSAGAKLLQSLDGNYLKVAESGLETVDDIRMMRRAGADAYLIGTALMKSANPQTLLRQMYGAHSDVR